MSGKAELEMQSALISTGQVQPIETSSRGGHLEILCRQVPGQERAWLETLSRLLEAADGAGTKVHLCRRYVMRDGQMAFGWHVQVDAANAKALAETIKPLKAVLDQARPSLTHPELSFPPGVRGAPQAPAAPPRAPQGRPGLPPPRPPNDPAVVRPAPDGFSPSVTTVSRGTDHDGKPTEVQEFPLPHVYRELNVPTRKGRGAKSVG